MKKIAFTIFGNQEDPRGNPIPYKRMTQKSLWTPQAQRYQNWKSFVVAKYLDTIDHWGNQEISVADFGDLHDVLMRKPIKKHIMGKIELMIYPADEHHADPDNIVKGILDALFQNDKHVDVSTNLMCFAKFPEMKVLREVHVPRVEVILYLL